MNYSKTLSKTLTSIFYIHIMRMISCSNSLGNDIGSRINDTDALFSRNQKKSRNSIDTRYHSNRYKCFRFSNQKKRLQISNCREYKKDLTTINRQCSLPHLKSNASVFTVLSHQDFNNISNTTVKSAGSKQPTCSSGFNDKTNTKKSTSSTFNQDLTKFNNQQLEKCQNNLQDKDQSHISENINQKKSKDLSHLKEKSYHDRGKSAELVAIEKELVESLIDISAFYNRLHCKEKLIVNYYEMNKIKFIFNANADANDALKHKNYVLLPEKNIKTCLEPTDSIKSACKITYAAKLKQKQFESNHSYEQDNLNQSIFKQSNSIIHNKTVTNAENEVKTTNENPLKVDQNRNVSEAIKFRLHKLIVSSGLLKSKPKSLEKHCVYNFGNIQNDPNTQEDNINRNCRKDQNQNEINHNKRKYSLHSQNNLGLLNGSKHIYIDHDQIGSAIIGEKKQVETSNECKLGFISTRNNNGNAMNNIKHEKKIIQVTSNSFGSTEAKGQNCCELKGLLSKKNIISMTNYNLLCEQKTKESKSTSSVVVVEKKIDFENPELNFEEIMNIIKNIDRFSFAFSQLNSLKYLFQQSKKEICKNNEVLKLLKLLLSDLKHELDEFRSLYFRLYHVCRDTEIKTAYKKFRFNVMLNSKLFLKINNKSEKDFFLDFYESHMKIQEKIFNTLEKLNKDKTLQIITNEAFKLYTYFYNLYIKPTFKLHKRDKTDIAIGCKQNNKTFFFIEFFKNGNVINLNKTSFVYEKFYSYYCTAILTVLFDLRSQKYINALVSKLSENTFSSKTNFSTDPLYNITRLNQRLIQSNFLFKKYFEAISYDADSKHEHYEILVNSLFIKFKVPVKETN